MTSGLVSGPTELELELDGEWSIGGKLFGGYLLRELVGATLSQSEHPHPLSVSAHFLSPPAPGPALVLAERLRAGRRTSVVRGSLYSGDRSCAEVVVTSGELAAPGPAIWADPERAIVLPPVEDCAEAPTSNPSGAAIGHLGHIDLRVDPATAGWTGGQPNGIPEIRGWMRPRDGVMGPLWLLIAVDALPPVTFPLGLRGWVPTVSFDVQLRALPTTRWVGVRHRAALIAGGWLDETCDIVDENGNLLASGRQLAAYREPEGQLRP